MATFDNQQFLNNQSVSGQFHAALQDATTDRTVRNAVLELLQTDHSNVTTHGNEFRHKTVDNRGSEEAKKGGTIFTNVQSLGQNSLSGSYQEFPTYSRLCMTALSRTIEAVQSEYRAVQIDKHISDVLGGGTRDVYEVAKDTCLYALTQNLEDHTTFVALLSSARNEIKAWYRQLSEAHAGQSLLHFPPIEPLVEQLCNTKNAVVTTKLDLLYLEALSEIPMVLVNETDMSVTALDALVEELADIIHHSVQVRYARPYRNRKSDAMSSAKQELAARCSTLVASMDKFSSVADILVGLFEVEMTISRLAADFLDQAGGTGDVSQGVLNNYAHLSKSTSEIYCGITAGPLAQHSENRHDCVQRAAWFSDSISYSEISTVVKILSDTCDLADTRNTTRDLSLNESRSLCMLSDHLEDLTTTLEYLTSK